MRLKAIRVGVSLPRAEIVVAVIGIAVGVSAADVIVDDWMPFVSGLLRVAIAVRRRMRMKVSISALLVRQLSR